MMLNNKLVRYGNGVTSIFFLYLLAGISALAECMDCPELKAAVEDFIQLHFTEVYKLDEFLQLDVTQLTYILHQDKLTVRAEAQVCTAVFR